MTLSQEEFVLISHQLVQSEPQNSWSKWVAVIVISSGSYSFRIFAASPPYRSLVMEKKVFPAAQAYVASR